MNLFSFLCNVPNVRFLSGPGLKGIELTLGLAHITIKVVEIAHGKSLSAGVTISRVEAFVVLDHDNNVMLLSFGNQVLMLCEYLDSGFCHQNMNATLNSIQRDGVVGRVGRENGDGIALLQKSIYGFLVCIREREREKRD